MPRQMIKAAFLDRDGVVNRKPIEGQYVTSWDDFQILPGVAEGIALLNRAGYAVIVVTNQRCVAKGLLTKEDLEGMHRKLSDSLAREGARIDGIYYCPHDYESSCQCRKPAPGMLLESARTHNIDLTSSWMIGDSEIDIQAGKRAGCKTARVSFAEQAANGRSKSPSLDGVEIVASSLLDSVLQILQREQVARSKGTTDAAAR